MGRAVKVDGRVSRAQKAREERRAALLVVARRIFSTKGYHATSIDDLIEGAGVARGTFYLYFESKRAIFDELLEGLFTTIAGRVKRIDIATGAPPPAEQMDVTVDNVFTVLVENREIARILLREAIGIDDDFDRKLSDFYGRIETLIVSAVQTGMQLGLVRQCDPEIVARCVLGLIKEVAHYAFVDRDTDQVDIRHLGREMIAFTLTGLFKR